jgi:S1-C subfamily serine protease
MRTILFLLLISFGLIANAQDGLVWKAVFQEDFNTNANNWQTDSSVLRHAQIMNGQLIDRFSKRGFHQVNKIPVSINTSKEYKISFSMANLNGNAFRPPTVYIEGKKGALKETNELFPEWGFVWGFKDWDNYNCIMFRNVRDYTNYISTTTNYKTAVSIYYKTDGKITSLLDWGQVDYLGTTPIDVSIEQNANSIRIYTGETTLYRYTGGRFKWFGNYVGAYIGSGAKVALDYITICEKRPHPTTQWTEEKLKAHWVDSGADQFEGIYESILSGPNSDKIKYAVKNSDSGLTLVYLSGAKESVWKVGDIKGYLAKTATEDLFKLKYFNDDKSSSDEFFVSFSAGIMKFIITDDLNYLYVKLFPTSSDNVIIRSGIKSSGSGFALTSNGYIVTNQHVIEGALRIHVKGSKGDSIRAYNAKVVIEDKNNDLAILKIEDPSFVSLGAIPYELNSGIIDVGSSVYTLGYPLRATMGDEIKLTNGLISSKSGYKGDITSYQISAPVQPGNSGGPLFDSKGNIIGIVNAKHNGAENAAYAIKMSYLINVIQSMNAPPKLTTRNTISTKSLSEQVKVLKDFVFIVEVN